MKYNTYKHKTLWSAMTLALVSLISLSSCQKVIDVKLDDADKKIVIDAIITNQVGGCIVKLSKTKSFKENNNFNGLSGATVSIKDEMENVTPLTETEPGIYTNAQLKGSNGKTYQLLINVEGKSYSSSSTMPDEVVLDSIYLEKQKFFGDEELFSNVIFRDPKGIKNYYLFKQFVNGKVTDGIFLTDDELNDGKKITSALYLFSDDDKKIKSGDVVLIEMQCIEKAVYKYWYSYGQSSAGGAGAATPSNPVSNISGDALGCFSAQTVQFKTVIAP